VYTVEVRVSFNNLTDVTVAQVSDQFTLGGGLLAAPVMEQNATTREVVLPMLPKGKPGSDSWYNFNSSTVARANMTLTKSSSAFVRMSSRTHTFLGKSMLVANPVFVPVLKFGPWCLFRCYP
jgi:hypothetical protein